MQDLGRRSSLPDSDFESAPSGRGRAASQSLSAAGLRILESSEAEHSHLEAARPAVQHGAMALYLVTGGAGFIGSHLTEALVRRGDRVRVVDDLSTGQRANLEHLPIGALGSGQPVEFLEASILDRAALRTALRGVEGVFHEAAQVSVPRSIEAPLASYEVNVTGTLNLLESARENRVGTLVFAASSAAYGNTETLPKEEHMLPQPLSPYASGKVAGEHLLRVYSECYGMRTVALRYFNIFGPRQADDSPYTGVIAIFARALLQGTAAPRIYGDGLQSRDFTYIDNVVLANLLALERAPAGHSLFNVGAGEQVTLLDLYGAMAQELGVTLAPEFHPPRAGDVRHSLASLERIRATLGYEPRVGWREGLRQTVAWYRERHRRAAPVNANS